MFKPFNQLVEEKLEGKEKRKAHAEKQCSSTTAD